MPVVSIQDSDHYYLRMLVTRVVGAKIFQDLRIVNGIESDTFQQTCQQLCLLKGDKMWHDTFTEASDTRMPTYLRQLFTMICGFGEPENLPEFLEKHKQSLSEDLIRKYSEETSPPVRSCRNQCTIASVWSQFGKIKAALSRNAASVSEFRILRRYSRTGQSTSKRRRNEQ
jgi:hypothetical protein